MLHLGKQLVCEPCSWIDCSISTEPPLEVLQISFTKGKIWKCFCYFDTERDLSSETQCFGAADMQLLSVPLKQ